MATTMYDFCRYKGHIVFAGDSHVRAVYAYIQSIRQVTSHRVTRKQMSEKSHVVEGGMIQFAS